MLKLLALAAALVCPCVLSARSTSPPALVGSRSAEDTDTKAVLATIDTLFAAFESGDAPFVVRVGGRVSNCGIDHFDLVREGGTWKVINLTFSSRAAGCPAH